MKIIYVWLFRTWQSFKWQNVRAELKHINIAILVWSCIKIQEVFWANWYQLHLSEIRQCNMALIKSYINTIKLSQRIFGKDLVNEIWIIDIEF